MYVVTLLHGTLQGLEGGSEALFALVLSKLQLCAERIGVGIKDKKETSQDVRQEILRQNHVEDLAQKFAEQLFQMQLDLIHRNVKSSK